MRALPHLGMEPREASLRLQLPPAEHAARVGVFEIAGTVRPSSRRAYRQAAEVRQRAVADDGCAVARSFDPGGGCEESGQYGLCNAGRTGGANTMNTKATATPPPVAPEAQESYIVSEGKKRGSTREVRPEAAFDRYYTVMRVHPGDAILTDNWHTNEVLDHARNNFEGVTFAMRTLEAWGAMIENDHRAYYTAGGRIWVMDLEPCEGKKKRLPGTGPSKK